MLHPLNSRRRKVCAAASLALALGAPRRQAREPFSVYLEDLTSPELQARIAAGATTVLVPIGGLEQSGPHIALGRHNVRARVMAGRIAQNLGNALVAPVVSYVPERSITPPAGHMRFAGTVSIPESAFEAVLESTARSFCQHGVRAVFFLASTAATRRTKKKRRTASTGLERAAFTPCSAITRRRKQATWPT